MALRDRMYVEEYALPEFYERLRAAGIEQAIVLSTCDRIEIQTIRKNEEDCAQAAKKIIEILAANGELAPDEVESQVYVLTGEKAVRQIFSVPASLDSLVVGEPQVLGQVKAAHRLAREMDMVGPDLDALLQAAFAAAKRVRRETAIGERPVSIATAAVELAKDLHGDLGSTFGLLVGGGDMGDMVAEEFALAGLGSLTVVHPNPARSEAAARALECHSAPWENLDYLLAASDLILTSMGQRQHSVSADGIQAAIIERMHKPIFIVDLAVPGDVDPTVDAIEDAFLYTLDDLERVAMEGHATRKNVAGDAWAIIDEEVAAYEQGQASLAAVPVLSDLRRHFEDMRDEVLLDAGGDAEKATRLLVNRLLHEPTTAMRDVAGQNGNEGIRDNEWAEVERVLRRLFRLSESGGKAGDA